MATRSKFTINRGYRGQAGESLVEVLVAIVIFSFGALGLLGLQTSVLRYQNQNDVNVKAAVLLSSIAEDMRANIPSLSRYVFGAASFDGFANASNPTNCVTVCDSSILARQNIEEWAKKVKGSLLSGSGQIVSEKGGYTLTVAWKDSKTASSSSCADSTDQVYCCPAALTTALTTASAPDHCMNMFFVP